MHENENKGNENESKGVQFPAVPAAEMPSDKINRGGWSAVARDSSKITAFVPEENQIRMRCDKRHKSQQLCKVWKYFRIAPYNFTQLVWNMHA